MDRCSLEIERPECTDAASTVIDRWTTVSCMFVRWRLRVDAPSLHEYCATEFFHVFAVHGFSGSSMPPRYTAVEGRSWLVAARWGRGEQTRGMQCSRAFWIEGLFCLDCRPIQHELYLSNTSTARTTFISRKKTERFRLKIS